MKTATDFSQSIKKHLTNTLYEVSLDGRTNILYINPKTNACRIVFDYVDMEKDSVCVKYNETIGTNNMVILEYNTAEPMGCRRETLLRDGYVVCADNDNRTSFFKEISDTENSGLFRTEQVNGEMNLMNDYGETIFSDNDTYIKSISNIYQNRYVIVTYANKKEWKEEYNIFDLANVNYVIDDNVDYVLPCFCNIEKGKFRFIQILNNECCMIDADDQDVLAKFKCLSVDTRGKFIIDADKTIIPFDYLEEHFDNISKVSNSNTTKDTQPMEQVFRLSKENGVPKQIALNIESDGSYSIKVTY